MGGAMALGSGACREAGVEVNPEDCLRKSWRKCGTTGAGGRLEVSLGRSEMYRYKTPQQPGAFLPSLNPHVNKSRHNSERHGSDDDADDGTPGQYELGQVKPERFTLATLDPNP